MRLMTIFCVVLFSSTALAQISPEEAMRRLEERRREAAAKPAAVQAAPATRQTRPPEELHVEAVELMRAGQFPKAGPLLEQAHKATAPAQLTRALVINRAIVDYMRGDNAARAVKDLSAYLATNPTDELAADLLGAAGRKAVDRSPRFANTALCKDAERILASCIMQLEATRPGMRKWGHQWMTAEQFRSVEEQRRSAQHALDSALSRLRSEEQRLASARQAAAANNTISTSGGQRRTGRRWDYDGIAAKQREEQERRAEAQASLIRAQAQHREAVAAVEVARQRLPVPNWPAVFEPVDPAAVGAIVPVAGAAGTDPPADADSMFAAEPAAAQGGGEVRIGMTLDQANGVMGKAGVKVYEDANAVTYAWPIGGGRTAPAGADSPLQVSTIHARFIGGKVVVIERK